MPTRALRPARSGDGAAPLAACAIVIASMALGLAATDIFLPSMTTIQEDLGATQDALKLVVSVFFVAYGVAQIFLGPLSDRFGRYRLLLGAQVLFLVSTIGCALASSSQALTTMRLFQGVGACAAGVVGRGVITDVLRVRRAAHVLTAMQAVKSIAPATAPILGAAIASAAGWRWSFWSIALCSALIALSMVLFMEETIREKRPALSLPAVVRDFGAMLKTPEFAGPIAISTLLHASMLSFLLSAPFLLSTVFLLSQKVFAVVQALHTVAFVAGVFAAGLLVGRLQPKHTLVIGTGSCIGVLLVSFLVSLGWSSVWTFCTATMLHTMCIGLTVPSANVSAVLLFRERAGTAASLQGGVFYVGSSLVGFLVSSLAHAAPSQVLLGMLVPAALAFVVALMGLRSTVRLDVPEQDPEALACE